MYEGKAITCLQSEMFGLLLIPEEEMMGEL